MLAIVGDIIFLHQSCIIMMNSDKKEASYFALVVLVLANLTPLIGVLYFEWSIFMVILLYWMESIVMGVYNILKILIANGPIVIWINNIEKVDSKYVTDKEVNVFDPKPSMKSKLFLSGFFLVHYGGFIGVF